MAPTLAPAKRLAKDLRALYTQPLPLYYLWADPSNPSGSLTSLDILLAGPTGTPYAQALFKLHLDIPATYPVNPPKAYFRTKIFHPNVEPSNGAVCLETLKRDWKPELTLADVLATIACLLIQPNPDSALNEEAGRMMHDGFEAFQRHARLMASIQARVPAAMRAAVDEALARGEETTTTTTIATPERQEDGGDENNENENDENSYGDENATNLNSSFASENGGDENLEFSEDKENDASQSPTPVHQSPPLPIRIGVKRPLADLPTPPADDKENSDNIANGSNEEENQSEKNIAANAKSYELAPSSTLPPNLNSRPVLEPVKRQGLAELSSNTHHPNQQHNQKRSAMMPPPAKKQATARARVGIRRL